MKFATLALICSLLLAGCKKDIQNEAAVKAGIMKYLATRQGLAEMDVSVSSVSFQKGEADAVVHFQAKGNSNPAEGLDMKYTLVQQGNAWVVKGRTGDGAGHGSGAMGAPHGATMPPMVSPNSTPGALPPGHPPVSGQSPAPEGQVK